MTGPAFATASVAFAPTSLGLGESMTIGVAALDFERWGWLRGTSPYLGLGAFTDEDLVSTALWNGFQTVFTMKVDVCGSEHSEVFAQDGSATTPADIPTS